jgi:DNA-binding NarL/FixJ family response regulator
MINIFIVDDHPALLRGVSSLFEDELDMRVVGTSSTASDALVQMETTSIDVLLTDLRMKGMDGDELARLTRAKKPEVQVAVLTNYHSDEDVFRVIRAGARAFLLKHKAHARHCLNARRFSFENNRNMALTRFHQLPLECAIDIGAQNNPGGAISNGTVRKFILFI